jgi:Zn finger protein HypA/HybF involved in hydrogenase expression
VSWYSVNESGTWCNACGHMLARQLQDYEGDECPECGFPEDGEKMAAYFAGDDEDEPCPRCGGDGAIEWDDASDVWGDDMGEGLENHMIDCPNCNGKGAQ